MRKVKLDTASVGSVHGTLGIVRDASTGRRIAEAETLSPHGFTGAALDSAREIAEARGWTVVATIRRDVERRAGRRTRLGIEIAE